MSKSLSCCQKYVMTSKIRHDVDMFAMLSKIRHDVKITSHYNLFLSFEKQHMLHYDEYSLPWKPSLFSSDISEI